MLPGSAAPFAHAPSMRPGTAQVTATQPAQAQGGWLVPAASTDPAIFVPVGGHGRPPGELRILLALRHPRVREVLSDLLAELGGMTVVAGVGTVTGALEAIGSARPDVVLLDDALDDVADGTVAKTSAFKLVPGIASGSPAPLVVMLSDYGNADWERQAARKAGAAAVVDKTDRIDRLISVIEQVWSGRFRTAEQPPGAL